MSRDRKFLHDGIMDRLEVTVDGGVRHAAVSRELREPERRPLIGEQYTGGVKQPTTRDLG